MKNIIRYSPFSSFIGFLKIKRENRLKFIKENLDKNADVQDDSFNIFKEICILDNKGEKKCGDAVFQVVFVVEKEIVEKVIKDTQKSIPFFIGLPGFCNKKFMVEKEKCAFSGKYEWESIEKAKNYANSYAVKFMAKRSSNIRYWIKDKKTGEVVLEKSA